MKTIKRIIVSALIFSKDNMLLMGQKDPKRGGVYIDCWHIPGGGINENESKKDALSREVKEEVGIDIANNKTELVSDTGKGVAMKTLKDTGERVLVKMQFFVYKITLDKNYNDIEVSLHDDLVKYHWFTISELSNVQLASPSVSLFKKLGYI